MAKYKPVKLDKIKVFLKIKFVKKKRSFSYKIHTNSYKLIQKTILKTEILNHQSHINEVGQPVVTH